MTLTPPTAGGSPLDRFRTFYAAAADLRRRVLDGSWPPVDSEAALEAAQAPLSSVLDQLAAAAAADPGTDAWTERQTRYLMTAFADDLFTRLDWPSREAWGANLLESQLFQTEEAADAVFERIDALLGIGDPGRRPLARAYLMALALGFRGKYQQDPDGSLHRYREALMAYAVPDTASSPTASGPVAGSAATDGDAAPTLSPEAYRHTAGPMPGKLLPNVRRWAIAAVAIVLLVGVLSIPLWRDATRSIGAAVERVLNR